MPATNIHFFSEDTLFIVKNKGKIRQWINHIVEKRGFRTSDLNYILCSDEYLLSMNQQYLNHDTYTDVITFDNNTEPNSGKIIGDIFISIDRIKENAEKLSLPTDLELHRVMIHGALHLLGLKDKSAKDKALMTAAEDESLSLLSNFI